MNTANQNVNNKPSFSRSDLGKLASINLLCLSDDQVGIIEVIYHIVKSEYINHTVRSLFEEINNNPDKLIEFCKSYGYSKGNITKLIYESLEYPDPQISQVEDNIKNKAEEIIAMNSLLSLGIKSKTISSLLFYYKGIALSKILEISQGFPISDIEEINKSFTNRRKFNELKIQSVRKQLSTKNFLFYTKLFHNSSDGLRANKSLYNENTNI